MVRRKRRLSKCRRIHGCSLLGCLFQQYRNEGGLDLMKRASLHPVTSRVRASKKVKTVAPSMILMVHLSCLEKAKAARTMSHPEWISAWHLMSN